MEDVMNAYRNIRFELKKLGYTEESAQRITSITPILGLNKSDFKDACLLCSEETAEKCHRRLLAEKLAQMWGVEIIDL